MANTKGIDPEVIERERKVLEARLLGLPWETIAKEVGYASAGAAYNAYSRALVRTLREPAEEIRQQELERLDRMMTRFYNDAIRTGNPASASTTLRIMERRAKLLGLDAPTKIDSKSEMTIYSGGGDIDAAVEELRKVLAERAGDSTIPVE